MNFKTVDYVIVPKVWYKYKLNIIQDTPLYNMVIKEDLVTAYSTITYNSLLLSKNNISQNGPWLSNHHWDHQTSSRVSRLGKSNVNVYVCIVY